MDWKAIRRKSLIVFAVSILWLLLVQALRRPKEIHIDLARDRQSFAEDKKPGTQEPLSG